MERWSFSPAFPILDLVSQQTLSAYSMQDCGGISGRTCSGQRYQSCSTEGRSILLKHTHTHRPGNLLQLIWAEVVQEAHSPGSRQPPPLGSRSGLHSVAGPSHHCKAWTGPSLPRAVAATEPPLCHFSVSSRDTPGRGVTLPVCQSDYLLLHQSLHLPPSPRNDPTLGRGQRAALSDPQTWGLVSLGSRPDLSQAFT